MAGTTRNRQVRQEALREQLSNQKHVEHVINLLDKIENDESMDRDRRDALKIVIDTKMKLVNKYLPDLKSAEITGEGGDPLQIILRGKDADV